MEDSSISNESIGFEVDTATITSYAIFIGDVGLDSFSREGSTNIQTDATLFYNGTIQVVVAGIVSDNASSEVADCFDTNT